MKFLKNEKGFSLIDIIVSIIIILLFMSLISVLFFNITKSAKGVERDSEATYIATNIIEAYKKLDYDDNWLTVGTHIIDSSDNEIGEEIIEIEDGYSATAEVRTYVPESLQGTSEANNDLVKIVTVNVRYKVAGQENVISLETSITR